MAKSNFIVRGGADFSGISKEMTKTQTQLKSFQSNISKSMKIVGAVLSTLAIGSFIKESTQTAMSVESSIDNISRTMGNSASTFNNWAQTQAKSFGMARSEAFKYGAVYSNLISGFTKDTAETERYTTQLLKASAIIASKTGRTIDDVSERIRSGLLGNTEAIEDVGIYAQVAMLKSTDAFKKIANGRSWEQLTYYEQQQVRIMSVLEQANIKYGNSLADTTATRQQNFIATLKNIQLNIGNAFLPIYNAVLPALNALASKIESVTATLSQFTQALFGKPIKEQTKATQAQTAAVSDLGDAAETAGKQAQGAVAGFDEINNLSDSSSGSDTKNSLSTSDAGTLTSQDVDIGVNVDTSQIQPAINMLNSIKTGASEAGQYLQQTFGPTLQTAMDNVMPQLTTFKQNLLSTFSDISTLGDPLKKWFTNDLVPFWQQEILTLSQVLSGLLDSVNTVFSGIEKAAFPVVSWFVSDGLPLITSFSSKGVEVFQALFNGVKKVFDTLWEDAVQPGLNILSSMTIDTLDIIKGFWDKHGKGIMDSLTVSLTNTSDAFQTWWDSAMKPKVDTILEAWKWLWDNHLKGVIETFADLLGKLIQGAIDIYNKFILPLAKYLSEIFGPAFNDTFKFVTDIVKSLIGTVADVAKGILETLGGIIDFIVGVFTGDWDKAWTGIKEIFKGIWDSMVGIAKGALNVVISAFNYVIRGMNKFKVDIPDWVSKITGISGTWGFNISEIPMLRNGGITNGPTVAVIGDNPGGREVVSPLDDLTNMITNAVSNAMLSVIQINDKNNGNGQAIFNIDSKEIAKATIYSLNEEAQRMGFKPILRTI